MRGFKLQLLLVAIIMPLPLWWSLTTGWPLSTDAIACATFIKLFSAQFWAGDVYPRWLIAANDGFGSPALLFYSPLTFYAACLLEWLSPVDPHGFGRVLLLFSIMQWIAGMTCYRWLRISFTQEQTIFGALLYAGFPYLFQPMYTGFSLPGLFALALFPLVMEATERVLVRPSRGFIRLSIGYVLLILTHVPSAAILGTLSFAYLLYCSRTAKKFQVIGYSIAAGLLAVVLTAAYWLPAMQNLSSINGSQYLQGKFSFKNSLHDPLELYNCLLGWGIILAPLVLLFPCRKQLPADPLKFWLMAIASLFFLTLPLSELIWLLLPPLQYMQFPHRLLTGAVPASVYLAALCMPYCKRALVMSYRALFVAAMVFFGVIAQSYFTPNLSPLGSSVLDHNLIISPSSEYVTPWMRRAGIDPLDHFPGQFLSMPSVVVAEGNGTAEMISQTQRQMTLKTQINTPQATLKIHRFYFPGWQVGEPGIMVHESDAMLAVTVPSGEHTITLSMPWFSGEKEGIIISGLALLFLIFISIFQHYQRTRLLVEKPV